MVFSVFSILNVLSVNVLVVSEWLAIRAHKHYKMTLITHIFQAKLQNALF